MQQQPKTSRFLSSRGNDSSVYDRSYNYSGRNAIGMYSTVGLQDDILNTNPTVQIGFLGLVSSMLGAEFTLGGNPGVDQKVSDYIREALFERMNTRFKVLVWNTFKALLYGVAPHEVTFKYEDNLWYINDMSYRPLRGFDINTLAKKEGEWWPTGRYQWRDHTGKVLESSFGAPGELDKALAWWPVYGESLVGTPLIRPIMNEHYEKSDIRKIRRIAIQKALFGTPYVHAAENSTKAIDDPEVTATLETIGQQFIDEEGCVFIPEWVKEHGQLFAQTDAISKSIDAENHCDIQTLQAFGSQWIARGLMSPYGSNAAGDSDASAQQQLRVFFFEWFSSELQPLIDWLIDLNFGKQTYYPELKVVSTQGVGPAEEVRAFVQLVQQGVVKASDKDDAHFRMLHRWPARDQATEREVPKAAPTVPGKFDQKTGLDTRDRENEEREEYREAEVK